MSIGYMQPQDRYAQPTPRQRLQTPVPEGTLAQLSEIPEGFPGTSEIIAKMKAMAIDAYQDERVNILARQVTINCPRHDEICEAATILAWFQNTFRYTRLPFNPKGFQRLQTPSYTLFDSPVKTGECASLSTAMAAMLMSMGFEVQFETGGQNAADPLDFEHVYLEIKIPGEGWVVADPSYEGPLGWRHPNAAVTRMWPLT